jgi:hypothetical protein
MNEQLAGGRGTPLPGSAFYCKHDFVEGGRGTRPALDLDEEHNIMVKDLGFRVDERRTRVVEEDEAPRKPSLLTV